MNKSEKRERLSAISKRLAEMYPESECALRYGGDGWRLLVMARLSAQCTDARVNEVSEILFSRFPTIRDMADADISEIEEIIRPCGLYRMKASNIKAAAEMVLIKYGGEIPDEMDELLVLPGVGRKIANLLLGDLFGKPAIVCDTHCIRICGRLGMYPEKEKNAEKIEKILRELLDLRAGSDFCHRIVEFGREVCSARAPRCDACGLSDLCERYIRTAKKATRGGV